MSHHRAQHLAATRSRYQACRRARPSRRRRACAVWSQRAYRRTSACSLFVSCTESIDDVTIDALCARLHRSERNGVVIRDSKSAHRAGLYACARNLHWSPGECRLICGHKLRRPGQARQRRSVETGPAEIKPRPAVPINKALHEFRRPLHH